MTYDPAKHHRRSIRLKGYDYSRAGLYFITICTQNRACLFGQIENGEMKLNDAGRMVENQWLKLPERFQNIALHEYIVMPNHFHAILEIVGATLVVAPNVVVENHAVVPNNVVAPNVVAENHVAAPNMVVRDNHDTTPNNHDATPNKSNHYIMGQPHIMGQPQVMGQPQGIAPTGKTVGDMVGAFESITTVEYIRGVKTNNWQPFDKKIWQRNYWEHIIRDERSYLNISEYIINNPSKWDNDSLKRN